MTLDLTLPIPELLASVAPVVGERIEKLLPRRFDAEGLAAQFGGRPEEYDANSLNAALADPLWRLLDAGGKRWRPALMLVAGAALGAPPESLLDLAAMCEMIHNATLLADDIEDGSPLRRGLPAAHVEFGVDVALNAGNALYFIPQAHLHDPAGPLPERIRLAALRVVNEEMVKLHLGQGMDIAWGGVERPPTVPQYLRMCAFKTGTLARMAVRLAAAAADAPERLGAALGRYAESIGVAFQIRDDVLNVTPGPLSEGKGFGDDIHEGKASLLVIRALQVLPRERADRLREILRLGTEDPAFISEAVALLEAAGAAPYARETATRLVREAWEKAAPELPDNAGARALQAFGEFVVDRDV